MYIVSEHHQNAIILNTVKGRVNPMNQDEADLFDNLWKRKYYAASRPFGTKDMFGQKQSCQTPTEKMGMSLVCGISEKTLVKRMYLKLGQKATNHKHI